jgi:membrane-bound lytic murein transglycosylase D
MKDRSKRGTENSRTPPLLLLVRTGGPEPEKHLIAEAAVIGRGENVAVRVDSALVSRRHAEVFFDNGTWWLKDLESRNGTYVQGSRVTEIAITETIAFNLGRYGPEVTATSKSRFTGGLPSARAYQDLQRKHQRRMIAVALVASVLIAALAWYGSYQRSQAHRQQQMAESLFYEMKSVELKTAASETTVLALKGREGIDEIQHIRTQRKEIEASYDHFLKQVGLYADQLSEQDRLILRVTRIFGECELEMPANFVSEVKRYIGYWHSTDKLEKAVAEAATKGYDRRIARALLDQDLPPQLFYLALQESSFDTYAVGPSTPNGIAKGMWQFMPETAVKYGLRLGPLYELDRPDPKDERHNFEKSTDAAARYLRSIYLTDAQASGLLVMASYNWGEGKVAHLIHTLPDNPHDRNFWRLLSAYRDKIPQQTYDYVFYIVAAAVIGENPRLFGFSFENPLRHLELNKI